MCEHASFGVSRGPCNSVRRSVKRGAQLGTPPLTLHASPEVYMIVATSDGLTEATARGSLFPKAMSSFQDISVSPPAEANYTKVYAAMLSSS